MSFLLHTDKPEPIFECEYVPDDNGGSNTPGENGKTPILQAGTATSLDPGSPLTVALPQNGVDADGNPIYVLNLGIPKGDTGDDGVDGKTPEFQDGTATAMASDQPVSMRLSQTGTDANGNPIYSLNLGIPVGKKGDKGDKGDVGAPGVSVVVQAGVYREPGSVKDLPDLPDFANTLEGSAYVVDDDEIAGQYDLYIHGAGATDWLVVNNWGGVPGQDGINGDDGTDGKTPIIQAGTATGLAAGASPTVQMVSGGTDANGNPIDIVNFGIPKGDKGDKGDGNLQADPTGIVAGKQYAFVPGADGSTTGTLQEVVTPSTPSTPDNFEQDVTNKFTTNSSARFIATKKTSLYGGYPIIELFGEDTSGSTNDLVITPEFGFGPDNSQPIAVSEYANPTDAATTEFKVLVDSETSVERGKLTVPMGCPKFKLEYFQGVEDIELTFNIPGATPEIKTVKVPVRQEYIIPSAEDLGFSAMPDGQIFEGWEVTAGAGVITSIVPTAGQTYNFVGKLIAVVAGTTNLIVTANLNSTTAAVFEQNDDGTKTKLHDFQLRYPLMDNALWPSKSGKYIYTFEKANASNTYIQRYVCTADNNFQFDSKVANYNEYVTSIEVFDNNDNEVLILARNSVGFNIVVNEYSLSQDTGVWSGEEIDRISLASTYNNMTTITKRCARYTNADKGIDVIYFPVGGAGTGEYGVFDVNAGTATKYTDPSVTQAHVKQQFAIIGDTVVVLAVDGAAANETSNSSFLNIYSYSPATGGSGALGNYVNKKPFDPSSSGIYKNFIASYNNPDGFTGIMYGNNISGITSELYALNENFILPSNSLAPIANTSLIYPILSFSPGETRLLLTQQTAYPYAMTFQFDEVMLRFVLQPTANGSPTAPCTAVWLPNVTS